MKIYDCFMFRDELDLLECRLMQFQSYPVYRHVLVEAAVDHRGNPKPLVFADNRERFAPWLDQIIHVVAGELPGMAGAFALEREAAQREATGAGLKDADPGDWLILADVDEIPNGTALQAVQDQQTGILEMTCCLFAVDWVLGPLRTSVICAAGAVTSFAKTRRDGWEWARISGAGHHLSWLGGQSAITAKTGAHCHGECDHALANENADDALYRRGVNPFGALGHNGQLSPVDVDETWPRYVYERHCPESWFRPRLWKFITSTTLLPVSPGPSHSASTSTRYGKRSCRAGLRSALPVPQKTGPEPATGWLPAGRKLM